MKKTRFEIDLDYFAAEGKSDMKNAYRQSRALKNQPKGITWEDVSEDITPLWDSDTRERMLPAHATVSEKCLWYDVYRESFEAFLVHGHIIAAKLKVEVSVSKPKVWPITFPNKK